MLISAALGHDEEWVLSSLARRHHQLNTENRSDARQQVRCSVGQREREREREKERERDTHTH